MGRKKAKNAGVRGNLIVLQQGLRRFWAGSAVGLIDISASPLTIAKAITTNYR